MVAKSLCETCEMRKPESFERFYYTKVGMGEACGCAEKIIDVYEFNRNGGRAAVRSITAPKLRFSIRGVLRKYGLLGRPRPPR